MDRFLSIFGRRVGFEETMMMVLWPYRAIAQSYAASSTTATSRRRRLFDGQSIMIISKDSDFNKTKRTEDDFQFLHGIYLSSVVGRCNE